MSRIRTIHNLSYFYQNMIAMVTQINCFTDKLAESETSWHLSKICTNKESVFEHLYKFEMVRVNDGNNSYAKTEAKKDFLRGETSFKHFLYNYEDSYLDLLVGYMYQVKKDCYVDLQRFTKDIENKIGHKHIGAHHEIYDTDENNREADIGYYFVENSLISQEVELSRSGRLTTRKEAKKVSKIDIPSKDCKLETVNLSIPLQPFIKEAVYYFRRTTNFMGLWLQTLKMMQTMYDRSQFMSYNPDDVITYQREIDLGLSRLQQTVMKILKFKHNRYIDDESDYFLHDNQSMFDEIGSIRMIFKLQPMRQFKQVIQKDLKFLMNKDITKKESSFFHELDIFVFKKTIVKDPPKYANNPRPEFGSCSEEEVQKNSTILTCDSKPLTEADMRYSVVQVKNYFQNYLKEILAHIRKLKNVEISEINKISSSSSLEKQTAEKVLSALYQFNFEIKKKQYGFGDFIGFSSKKTQPSFSKRNEIDRESRALHYDYYTIEEIQETDLFIFYSQSNKMLSTVSLKLLQASLDSDANETALLLKKSLPFYTLNNLRLAELDGLLFHSKHASSEGTVEVENDKDSILKKEESSIQENESNRDSAYSKKQSNATGRIRPPKFEYRKLRQYLYIVKRIELKNRSNSRNVFTFVDEVKSKMTQILDDVKLTKPDTVFNTYLNCLYENEQRAFTLALLDTLSQVRWLENFYDIIDINLEKLRKDKELYFLTRSVLIKLLFPKNTSFKVFFDLFSNSVHLNKNLEFAHEKYPNPVAKEVLLKQLYSKKLYSMIRKNNFLNMFESSIVSQAESLTNNEPSERIRHKVGIESFNEFSFKDFDYRWDSLFTQLLAFKSPQRTFISKKSFQILLATSRDTVLPEQSILPHNIWIYKILDSHRLLDLNLKNMLLIESLNSKIVNDLFCDVTKERSSVVVEDIQINNISLGVNKRKFTPSLLPFVSNSMFQKEENYDFYRMILRLFSMELHLTSHMTGQDLLSDRFPDLNTSTVQKGVSSSDIELKLRSKIRVETVWSNNPFLVDRNDKSPRSPTRLSSKLLRKNSEDDYISKPKKNIDKYDKETYNEHKVEILKAIIENLRQTFFLSEVPHAFNLCYLLMREFVCQATKEEISNQKLYRFNVMQKSEKCKERDTTILSVHREMMTSLVTNSYVIETTTCGDNMVIRKSDINRIALRWNDQFMRETQEELRKREVLYLIKIDDIQMEIDHNILNKELIDFYFNHIITILRKVVGSRLVLRNSSFVTELDSMARYIGFMTQDYEMTYDKIEARMNQDIRKMITDKNTENSLAKASFEDNVKTFKKDFIAKIRIVKEEQIVEMKEYRQTLDSKQLLTKGQEVDNDYQIKVPVYEQEQYYTLAAKLCKKINDVKVFNILKLYAKSNKIRQKHLLLLNQVHEEEKLNEKLEGLLKDEKNLKGEIIEYQKNISRLEIQNNILRKDIHNSQFERIKLLKKTNELKNKFDELQWEGHKFQAEKKSQPRIDTFMQDYDKQYLKNLFAENNMVNLDYHNHPERLIEMITSTPKKGRPESHNFKQSVIKNSLSKNDQLMKIEYLSQNKVISSFMNKNQVLHSSSSIKEMKISNDSHKHLQDNMPQSVAKLSTHKDKFDKSQDEKKVLRKHEASDNHTKNEDEIYETMKSSQQMPSMSKVNESKDFRHQSEVAIVGDTGTAIQKIKSRGLISATTKANSQSVQSKNKFFKKEP